jgi:uncharacterized protein YjlB
MACKNTKGGTRKMRLDRSYRDYIHERNAQCFLLKDDGTIPNNEDLPLLVYEDAIRLPQEDAASIMEEVFSLNRWGKSWRNGVYGYHHYHSTAHEVLGVYSGTADIQLGGAKGITQKVRAGDVLVIPAGVGHKKLNSSHDFAVVGAYPEGQHWDMCYGKPEERPEADQNIARVPLPSTDPVYGAEGQLRTAWQGK